MTVNQDVVRFNIAVHGPGAMRGIERCGHRCQNRQDEGRRQGAESLQQGGNRAAGDILHRNKMLMVIAADVVDSHDVRVVQLGGNPRFTFKPLQVLAVGAQRCGEHLERDNPLQLQVTGTVHARHTAAAELVKDFVAADSFPALNRHCTVRRTTARQQPELPGCGALMV